MPVPVISIAQMREWEKATWASGRSEEEVIRRAGLAVAQQALRLTRSGDRILILAGKGHNGDDARCAREQLPDRRVEVLEVSDPAPALSKLDAQLSPPPALVIDGLFGIGLDRLLAAPWIRFIERVNAARLQVLAVDIPSGLNGDTGIAQGAAIHATMTLTLGAPKTGLLEPAAWPYVGRLETAAGIGLVDCPHTSDLEWTLAGDFDGFPPPRPVAGHKGNFGHLAILAGSVGYHGAAVLAARGAQRAGPGLISVYTHEPAYAPVAAQLQAVMVHPWTANFELPENCSAVLIGPGLAAPDLPGELRHLTQRLWRELTLPLIVDASALDWLPSDPPPKGSLRVITPHPGEAARILQTTAAEVQAARPKALRRLSERRGGCLVVLKGHETLVGRETGRISVNGSGNPHLAQGGAGDLLGGYLAGLLAQPALREDAFRTIRFAVWQHGAAADRLQSSRPNWTVEDLAEVLGS